MNDERQRIHALFARHRFDPGLTDAVLAVLDQAGLAFADRTQGEFVCRWVDTVERDVPPDADTIIRTVTRTSGDRTTSRTHWLEGIVSPPPPADPT